MNIFPKHTFTLSRLDWIKLYCHVQSTSTDVSNQHLQMKIASCVLHNVVVFVQIVSCIASWDPAIKYT